MPTYLTPWSRSFCRTQIRQELMDPSGVWWSDSLLNLWISNWQNELQQEFEFVWGSSTWTGMGPSTSTCTASSFVGTHTLGVGSSTYTYISDGGDTPSTISQGLVWALNGGLDPSATAITTGSLFTITARPSIPPSSITLTSTESLSSSTIQVGWNILSTSSISPSMERVDAIYWVDPSSPSMGYRLSGRLLQDLEVGNPEWRNALPDNPREVIQYDSTQLLFWPPPSSFGPIIFEYPLNLTLSSDGGVVSLPIWTQWSLKYYACKQAYLQPGPTNDLQKSLRYEKLYQREKLKIKTLWDNFLPDRYRKLKPMGHYEVDILKPPPAWATGIPT